MNLQQSVGQSGTNQEEDVRLVQKLLNESGRRPELRVDGDCGQMTIQAIRWFQERAMAARSPDGRVDPGGRTWHALRKRDPEQTAPRADAATPETRSEYRVLRAKHVGGSVKENGNTTRIIDALVPHLHGTDLKIISGWLSDSDLFWKVNYHWELLLYMVQHAKTLPIDGAVSKKLDSIASQLGAVTPQPSSGYRTSPTVGKPVDTSDAQTFDRRYGIVTTAKRDFKSLVESAGLMQKSNLPADSFHLAVAPVAHPGTSKHATGYALDIKGPAGTVKSLCKGLGASLVFDEKSHVHVEFKNGVASR
jgi:peptidoglycan hydrolase-like protein with peptidoglycan-binding domain